MVTRTSQIPSWSWHLVWLAMFAVAFAPTVGFLINRWTVNIYYNGHGIFVPFIVAWLVRENLKEDPIREPQSSPWGLPVLGVGLAMLALDTAIRTELLAAVGLVVCLPGLSLLLLGLDRTRKLAFPLAISVFMLPIPAGAIGGLHMVLRQVSAWGSTLMVEAVGVPVLREGTTMHLPGAVLEVADACSGVSSLLASLLLALILAHSARHWSRRLLIMGAATVLAIACNIVRVAALTLIAHYWGPEMLDTFLHELSGMLVFCVVLVVLFAISDRGPRAAPA